MTTTQINLTGQSLKTGRTGKQPRVTGVLWQGTASVICYDEHRVPAALVNTTSGVMAAVRLRGNDLEGPRWWDARCVRSREWETDGGQLIGDHAIAQQIDDILATATAAYEREYQDLNRRVSGGLYSIS